MTTARRWLYWGAQAVAGAVVAAMVIRTISRDWDQFRSLQVTLALHPGWISLSALAVLLTYALQISSWRRVLAGWAQHLSFGAAARIWLVVNLGRYIPGKVWSVAGLIVMAQRAGVPAWAAGASAFAMQALGVGTAVALVAAAAPSAESPLRLALAGLAAAATMGFLAWERGARWLARTSGLGPDIRPLPLGAVGESAALSLASWLTYGLAFWLLARGLGLPNPPPLATAAGVFALGYLVGVLALFAPGGVGVREVVLISLLTPALGAGGAVALSLASRILLTLTEVAAPIGILLLRRRSKEDTRVRT